jgi:23S rRNA (uracil1939-C5)-methyltransferase
LSRKELEPFDVAVFDPPRSGAAAQAHMLAKSKVPVVVAVSCNPLTLARDVRSLIDGGYALGKVTPIDQFTWSAHVEAVAVLRR